MKKLPTKWKPSPTAPKIAPSPDFIHHIHGYPSKKYLYYNSDGSLAGYACRFELPNATKVVLPYCYGALNEQMGWYYKGLARPTPLYGILELAQYPTKKVIFVEGEKSAEAARTLFPDYVVLSSFGGSCRPHESDFSMLKGRSVTIWRDNDEAGKKWQKQLIEILQKAGASEILIVDIPHTFPEKWDLADALPPTYNQEKLFALLEAASACEKEPKNKKEPKKQSRTIELIEAVIASLNYELMLDQFGEAFIRVEEKTPYSCPIPLASSRFKLLLRSVAYTNFKEALGKEVIDQIVGLFTAMAHSDPNTRDLNVRTARVGANIFYDLGDCSIKISSQGWQKDMNPPSCFRQYSNSKSQVHPAEKGDLKDLLHLVNVSSKNDQLLLLVSIVTAFISNIPHPILAIHGPQGSAKSSLTRLLVRLIDPSATEDIHISKKTEFIQNVSHRLVVPLDNLSTITPEMSDLLCKVVTGGGFSKRRLYTDDDDKAYSFRRSVILNGIHLVPSRPDLLDRCLLVELEKISPDQRKTEGELYREFNSLLPRLLGSCFDLVAKTLAGFEEAEHVMGKCLPRMADFFVWGCAAAKALGYSFNEFEQAYKANASRLNQEAIDSSPLATAIVYCLDNGIVLNEAPTNVLGRIKNAWNSSGCGPHDIPQSVNSFARQLSTATPILEARGISVVRSKSGSRFLKIFYRPSVQIAHAPNTSICTVDKPDASFGKYAQQTIQLKTNTHLTLDGKDDRDNISLSWKAEDSIQEVLL